MDFPYLCLWCNDTDELLKRNLWVITFMTQNKDKQISMIIRYISGTSIVMMTTLISQASATIEFLELTLTWSDKLSHH